MKENIVIYTNLHKNMVPIRIKDGNRNIILQSSIRQEIYSNPRPQDEFSFYFVDIFLIRIISRVKK